MKFEHKIQDRAENPRPRPIICLVAELDSAAAIIDFVDDITYRRRANGGSIGAQFRHNLDFINAFLKGVEIGRMDYGDRERDVRIENDRSAAIARIQTLKIGVTKLDPRSTLTGVSVRSEIDDGLWLPSSVWRELEFVHSHTVHHHALIAEKLVGFGIRVEKDFGVAPSTLRYWEKQAA
jgi:hypothetical protein